MSGIEIGARGFVVGMFLVVLASALSIDGYACWREIRTAFRKRR